MSNPPQKAGHQDGAPRKLLDVSRLRALGWKHRIELGAGIASTYDWFQRAMAEGRVRGMTPVPAAVR